MKIKLSDEERERYGCPEWLDCDIKHLSVAEAEAIEDETGINAADAIDLMGAILAPDGKDGAKARLQPKGIRLRVWLGLRRADINVPFAELKFEWRQFSGWHSLGGEDEGKAEASETSDASTA